MENQFTKGEITSLHDIKEVSKKTIQFVFLSLIIAAFILPVRFFSQQYISALVLSFFCVFLSVILFLNKKGYRKYVQASAIIGINIFLVAFSYTDGLRMGSYLYFFPMLFSIPFLVNNHEKYHSRVVSYFSLVIVCMSVTFLFSKSNSPFQNISDSAYAFNFNINLVSAVLLSAAFSYLNIHFERKFAHALIEQKHKTIDAMKTRGHFLSHMGHELRTPLNGIIGASNLLTKGKTLPEQEEFLNILKYCSNHMLDVINNILDYNKIDADKMDLHLAEVNLKQLLENAVLPFHNRLEEKRIEWKLDLDRKMNETVMADDIRLTQVINNLVSNALKFTEKGYIRFGAKCTAENAEVIEVQFSVEDTGIGINKENQKKIFESFEQVYTESTRKYGGTGLGLTISQRLLKLMNSQLQVSSEEGIGSKFFFTLSFRKASGKQTIKTVAKIESADLAGLRVLIAEDNLINMLIATKMLEDWNVNFTTAGNGKEALSALKQNADYDLILLDLEMPEMDGYTAVKEITKLYPDVPVLAFTATLVDHEMYDHLKQMGFVDAMLKPFQPMELFSKIRYYAN
jgi:signal transduction histidine kinase/BarA-like signal transduction histidine kinase